MESKTFNIYCDESCHFLEPLRNKDEYYMLTAYHLEGKDMARKKMDKKYKRRIGAVV